MKNRFRYCLVTCIVMTSCFPPPQARYDSAPGRRHVQVSATQAPAIPKLKRLANGHYRVVKPWTVNIGGRVWQVQKGYSSNGITAPARVKASLGDGIEFPETWAAVFHDWLFTQKGVTRSQADQLFYDLLIAYGVPARKASMMHTVVSAYSASKIFR